MTRTAKIWLLVAVFLVCGAAVVVQGWLEHRRQAAAPGELYHVVSEQLAAFRADDFPGAYRQVSMGFQERVKLEAFADLARTEYPALLRAMRVEFGPARFQGGTALVSAYFIMPEGDVIPCIYTLIREDGAWKIDYVHVLPRWPANRRLGGMRT
jgi:hypothetical protein